jgi:hypothetical protein
MSFKESHRYGNEQKFIERRFMEKVHLSTCEHCGNDVSHLGLSELPVEPLYDLRIAAYMIPMRYEAVRKWLYRNKALFPPRYRLHGHSHRRIRLLSASEIRTIRSMAIRTVTGSQAGLRLLKAAEEVPPWAEPSCVMDVTQPATMTPEEVADLEQELFGEDEESPKQQDQQPSTQETTA